MSRLKTPKLQHDPIPMNYLGTDTGIINQIFELREVGDFFWKVIQHREGQRRWLYLALPLELEKEGRNRGWVRSQWSIDRPDPNTGHSWSWDGNEEAPTLSPSLHAVGVWHGWVREGRLVEHGYRPPKESKEPGNEPPTKGSE